MKFRAIKFTVRLDICRNITIWMNSQNSGPRTADRLELENAPGSQAAYSVVDPDISVKRNITAVIPVPNLPPCVVIVLPV